MNRFLFCLLVGISLGQVSCQSAKGQGNEVVVIYNSRVPESKGVAEHYAAMRHVPAAQVMAFDLPEGEAMSRSDFRERLQKPLLKALATKGLVHFETLVEPATDKTPRRVFQKVTQSSVRYLAPVYGVPIIISNDGSIKEEGSDVFPEGFRRNEAAVDSELACLLILDRIMLTGPLTNWVYNCTNVEALNPTNGIFLVSRLDGPTATIARNLVDKAMEAETNGLCGRAYIDTRGITDGVFKMGDDWMREAAEICRWYGYDTVVDTNNGTFPASFPLSQVAIYCGWYDEHASGPFARPTVEFMPGAFAYHLHSFSAGTLRSTRHQWVGPLLDRGATVTMGCVAEPYLSGTPVVSVVLDRLIVRKYSFAEAAWCGQYFVSWQTTVVGDPLYRPFTLSPEQLEKNLHDRQSKLEDWFSIRRINNSLSRGMALETVTAVLEHFQPTQTSAILQEKLAQLHLEDGKPNSSVRDLQQALKLDPTPQQRMRLMLDLASQLVALGQDKDAFEVFERFLKDCPDYPDMPDIYRRLIQEAEKSGLKDDAAKYQRELNAPHTPVEKAMPIRKGI